jgi:hypothetical protein
MTKRSPIPSTHTCHDAGKFTVQRGRDDEPRPAAHQRFLTFENVSSTYARELERPWEQETSSTSTNTMNSPPFSGSLGSPSLHTGYLHRSPQHLTVRCTSIRCSENMVTLALDVRLEKIQQQTHRPIPSLGVVTVEITFSSLSLKFCGALGPPLAGAALGRMSEICVKLNMCLPASCFVPTGKTFRYAFYCSTDDRLRPATLRRMGVKAWIPDDHRCLQLYANVV